MICLYSEIVSIVLQCTSYQSQFYGLYPTCNAAWRTLQTLCGSVSGGMMDHSTEEFFPKKNSAVAIWNLFEFSKIAMAQKTVICKYCKRPKQTTLAMAFKEKSLRMTGLGVTGKTDAVMFMVPIKTGKWRIKILLKNSYPATNIFPTWPFRYSECLRNVLQMPWKNSTQNSKRPVFFLLQ